MGFFWWEATIVDVLTFWSQMVLMNIKPLYCGGRLSKLFSFNPHFWWISFLVELVESRMKALSSLLEEDQTVSTSQWLQIMSKDIIVRFKHYNVTICKFFWGQGYVEDLPQMNHARTEHGCGLYHKDGKKVRFTWISIWSLCPVFVR